MFSLNGENALFISTAKDWADQSAIPTIYSTGYSSTATGVIYGAGGVTIRRAASEAALLSIGAGGTSTFGNDAAIASIDAAVESFKTLFGPRSTPFLLIGGSMGFCDLMAWARTRPNDVNGVIALQGLVDLDEAWAANREIVPGTTSTAAIDAAYGGVYSPDVNGPTRSPIQFAGSMPFPIHYFKSDNDPLIPSSTVDALEALDNVTVTSVGSVGHGASAVAASSQVPEFLDFIRKR